MRRIIFSSLRNNDIDQCPPPDVLQQYVNRVLVKKEMRRIEDHIDICPACLTACEGLISMDKGQRIPIQISEWEAIVKKVDENVHSFLKKYQSAPAESESEYSHRPVGIPVKRSVNWIINGLFQPRRLIFAGLTALIILCFTYGAAYLNRPSYYKLAELDPFIESTMRSQAGASDVFSEGLDLFYRRQYRQAILRLEHFTRENPDDFNSHFYMGLSYLYNADIRWLGLGYAFDHEKVEKAVLTFEKILPLCKGNRFYQEDCHWYLGKAYLMRGDLRKAHDQFKMIVEMDQPGLMRRKEAQRVVEEIEMLKSKIR